MLYQVQFNSNSGEHLTPRLLGGAGRRVEVCSCHAWPNSYDLRPSPHLHNTRTDHVGFSPTRQTRGGLRGIAGYCTISVFTCVHCSLFGRKRR